MTAQKFSNYTQDLDHDSEYVAGSVIFHVQENIVEVMRQKGWNRTDLAKALNTSKAAVTGLLRSEANLTVKRIAAVAIALDVSPFELLRERTGAFGQLALVTEFRRPASHRSVRSAAVRVTHVSTTDTGSDHAILTTEDNTNEPDPASTAA